MCFDFIRSLGSPLRGMCWTSVLVFALMSLGGMVFVPSAASGQISGFQKVSDTRGDFFGTLNDADFFGTSVAQIADLNGDGNHELAVGADFDDDGGTDSSNRGAVWILFPNDDGTIQASQKISDTAGGFGGTLKDDDHFGASVADLGTLGGNPTIVVGSGDVNDGGTDRGAVWIIDLDTDGTVADEQRISDTAGGFGGTLDNEDHFGSGLAYLGTFGGTPTLAVGAPKDGDGGTERGAIWLLELNTDGTVSGQQKISSTSGGFGGSLSDGDELGSALTSLGDLSGDGTAEVAAGARLDDDGGTDSNRGAVWVLSLRDDGTVAAEQKISDTAGGFSGTLDDVDVFGTSLASLGDLNGDGVTDLAVGAPADDDGGSVDVNRGAVWVLYLNGDGSVASSTKISDTQGGFTGVLNDQDQLGDALSPIGDLDDNNVPDIVAGAPFDDDGGTGSNRGAVWVLFGDQALLPVELSTFDATQTEGDAVRLSWTTASEQNNGAFRVQHAGPLGSASPAPAGSNEDGRWTTLGSVAGSGTTSQPQNYTFTAKNLSIGTHEFRLRQVDLDGTTNVHDPISVDVQMEEPVRLEAPAPNPVQQQATLSFAVQEPVETRVTLHNALGQKVATLFHGRPEGQSATSVPIQTAELASGIYFIRLYAGPRTRTERLTVVQ